jgi:hypothetical protein
MADAVGSGWLAALLGPVALLWPLVVLGPVALPWSIAMFWQVFPVVVAEPGAPPEA